MSEAHAKQVAIRKEAAEAKVKEGAEKQAAAVAETNERLAGAVPTPTQEENDKMRMGVHLMEKDDDGSGPERLAGVSRDTKSATAKAPASYSTRDMAAPAHRAPAPVKQADADKK